jgi:hypothetical protein
MTAMLARSMSRAVCEAFVVGSVLRHVIDDAAMHALFNHETKVSEADGTQKPARKSAIYP